MNEYVNSMISCVNVCSVGMRHGQAAPVVHQFLTIMCSLMFQSYFLYFKVTYLALFTCEILDT